MLSLGKKVEAAVKKQGSRKSESISGKRRQIGMEAGGVPKQR